ncbi:Holliday junction branch migration protein RuvA [Mediterraneibacter agrestimuris]|uniref:Holliday junction branch migration protein RuvA n=1 Tax=Mediterraneibacter agrestimuris TaxID=2941333 RepID=UPI00203B9BBF|nr:Holliday junction branch migration protein RuvA [Mediterraneibacter agrestimuris]
MISYIRGELAAVEKEKVIIDVGGIGYGIFMPEASMGLLPQMGNEVKLHTYLNVREDAMQLFGFLTRDDLEVFRLLIGVSGIGPKGGLSILSRLTSDDLRFAVLSGDAKAISAAPGIGKKTAEKVIIELKDKLDIEDVLNHSADGGAEIAATMDSGANEIQSEAVQALVALGYGSTESLKAVKKVSLENATVEEVLKQALKNLF